MSLSTVVVYCDRIHDIAKQGLNLFLPDRLLVQVTDDFPAPYFRPWTLVALHRLGVIKNFHADPAVGKLLVWMPGVEVDHQVVFLVEGKAADEAAQLGLLLVLGLDVGQQQRPLTELLPTLGTRPSPAPLTVGLGHVQVIQPPLLEDLGAYGAGETLTRFYVKFLVFLEGCSRCEGLVTNRA